MLAALSAGQGEDLAVLYDRYGRYVFGVAAHMLGNTPAAEDVTQEVFLRLWRNASRFDVGRGRLSTWLLHMTRNAALDVLRARKGQQQPAPWAEEVQDLADAAPAVDAQAEVHILGHQVRSALGELPPEQRLALEMAYFGGLTHQEIAEQTRQPLGTVKSRIRLALEHLRTGLLAPRRREVRQGDR